MQNLSEIKSKNPGAYHNLMHGLYVRVTYVLSLSFAFLTGTDCKQWRIGWIIRGC